MKTKFKIFYWLPTSILAIVFLVTGLGNLIPFEHIKTDMLQLGYPLYFMAILGTWKILAAIALIIPVNSWLKDWAYAGILFDLTGASFSRMSVGSPSPEIIIPLINAMVSLVSFYNKNRYFKLKKAIR